MRPAPRVGALRNVRASSPFDPGTPQPHGRVGLAGEFLHPRDGVGGMEILRQIQDGEAQRLEYRNAGCADLGRDSVEFQACAQFDADARQQGRKGAPVGIEGDP